MNVEKLKRLQAQVRIGGKGTPRRKKKVIHQTATTDDKKLQSSLKKLSVSTIPGIEEVNIIKDDLTVIHFNNPKAQASLSANTFAVTGHGETKKIVEMLPDILPQLGQETVVQLRMFANSMSNNQKHDNAMSGATGTVNILDSVLEEDDVPMLVSDFDEVAKAEAAIVSKQLNKSGVDTGDTKSIAEVIVDSKAASNVVPAPQQEIKTETADNILNEIKIEQILIENNLTATANSAPKSDQKQKNNRTANDVKENKKQNKKDKQEAKPVDKKDNKKEKDTNANDRKINEKQAKPQNKAQQQQKEVNKKGDVQIAVAENKKDNVDGKEKLQESKVLEDTQVPKSGESTQAAKPVEQTTKGKPDKPNAQQASKKPNDNKQQTGKQAKQANNEKKPAATKSNEAKPPKEVSPAAPVANEAVKQIEIQPQLLENLPVEPVAQVESTAAQIEQQKETTPTKQLNQKDSNESKIGVESEAKVEDKKEVEPKIEENKKVETNETIVEEQNKIEEKKVVAGNKPNVEAATNEPKVVPEQQQEAQAKPTAVPEIANTSAEPPKEGISEQVDAKQAVLPIDPPLPTQEQVQIEKTIEETIVETKAPELALKIENLAAALLEEQRSNDNKTDVDNQTTVAPIVTAEQTMLLESGSKVIEPEMVEVQETKVAIKAQPELKLDIQKCSTQIVAEKPLDISAEPERTSTEIKDSETSAACTVQNVLVEPSVTQVESKTEDLTPETKEKLQPTSPQLPQETKQAQNSGQVQKVETKSGPTTPTAISPKQKASPPPKQTGNNNRKAQDSNKQQTKNAAAAGETTQKSTNQTDAKKSEAVKQKQTSQGKSQPQQQQQQQQKQQQQSTKSPPSATKPQQSPNKSAPTTPTTPTTPTKTTDKPALPSKPTTPTTPTTPTKPNTPTADAPKKANAQQKQQQGDTAAKGKQQGGGGGGGGGGKARPATAAGGNATKATKPAAPHSPHESTTNAPAAAGK